MSRLHYIALNQQRPVQGQYHYGALYEQSSLLAADFGKNRPFVLNVHTPSAAPEI
jgi:hypothetical protein